MLLLSETTPPGGRSIESMFEDDQLLVDPDLTPGGNATVAATLDTLKLLGVDRIRVLVEWSTVAPDAGDATAPAGFDAADPAAYPSDSDSAGWSRYDRIDEAAAADGIAVDFDLSGPAPDWATTPQPAGSSVADQQFADVYGPSATDFEDFVKAAGKRYSGTYVPAGAEGHALPRVSFWSVWNEPNQPGWLSPQNSPTTGTPLAPALYRSLVDAYWDGLVETGHTTATDTILIGELAPNGCVTAKLACPFADDGHDYWSQAPITFLEDLYCVGPGGRDASPGSASSTGLEILTGAAATALDCPSSGDASTFAAQNPGLFNASGLSEHPYSFFLLPDASDSSPNERTFVPLSDLSRLESAIDAAFSAYGYGTKLPLYLTEYGYVTNPPNVDYPYSPAQQAVFLDEAEYMAVQDPRVKALSQFELQDSRLGSSCGNCSKSNPAYYHSFQEGLEYYGGRPKPAFSAYRLPIFLPDIESTSPDADAAPDTPVEVWGMIRPAKNGDTETAQIEWEGQGSSSWKTLARVTTKGPDGILSRAVVIPGTGSVRLAWKPSSVAAVVYSRSVPVTVKAT